MRASVVLRVFCTLVVAALAPSPAAAHLNSTGLGPIYDGAAHFLTSPDDLLAVLALSLWAGLHGASYGRRALFTLPGAWLLGSLVGMTTLGAVGGGVVSAFWLMGLGTLLAAKILRHLGLPMEVPAPTPARQPAWWSPGGVATSPSTA